MPAPSSHFNPPPADGTGDGRVIARERIGGLAAAIRLVPRLLRYESFGRINRDAYEAYYGLAGVRWFVNKGLAPVDPAMPRPPELEREPYGAALYFEVLRRGEAALGRAPRRVVEAACGPGGGLILAAAMWRDAALVGFDLQPAAARLGAERAARAAPGRAAFAAADGFRLPLADGTVELLLSVEGLLNLGRDAFLGEARRVLASGGVLVATGSMKRPFREARGVLEEVAPRAGLEVVSVLDLTQAILTACRDDAARRLGWTRRLPGPLRRPFETFAGAPGSATYESYASGARSYYLTVLRRRAERDGPMESPARLQAT